MNIEEAGRSHEKAPVIQLHGGRIGGMGPRVMSDCAVRALVGSPEPQSPIGYEQFIVP